MNNSLCEFSKDVSQGLQVHLLCNIINNTCMCYRPCNTQKFRMLPSYNTCPIRTQEYNNKAGETQYMGRPPKKIEEIEVEANEVATATEFSTEDSPSPTQQPKKPKSQKIVCDVLYKNPSRFAINFNGDGISFRDTTPQKTNKVEVTFTGTYGDKSFNITGYKFI